MRTFSLSLSRLHELDADIRAGMRIFLYGSYGVGKTALVQHILTERLWIQWPVTSPTYGYFQEYPSNVLHFDLTRVQDYDHFTELGLEEYFDNPNAIILVEWPEILAEKIIPDLSIRIETTEDDGIRKYTLFDRLDDTDFLYGSTDSSGDLDDESAHHPLP